MPKDESRRAQNTASWARQLAGVPLVTLVCLIIFYTWYVHTIRMEVDLFQDFVVLALLETVFWQGIIAFICVSYFRITTSSPGYAPLDSNFPDVEAGAAPLTRADIRAQGAGVLSLEQRKEQKREGAQFCSKCGSHKPERAHHCRLCGRCVLRMDHHCPWVNNCVGERNYKYFALFVWWAGFGCAYNTITLGIWGAYRHEADMFAEAVDWMVVWVNVATTATFSIMLIFLGVFHCTLVASNSTTIETMSRNSRRYKLKTLSENIEQSLGSRGWILPCVKFEIMDKGQDDMSAVAGSHFASNSRSMDLEMTDINVVSVSKE